MGQTLTLEERETIITFDETPEKAVIFTYNKTWQQHLEKKLGLKPVMNNGYGGREYHIDKKLVRPPRVPVRFSGETKQKMIERLHRGRPQKPPNSAGNACQQGRSPAKGGKGV